MWAKSIYSLKRNFCFFLSQKKRLQDTCEPGSSSCSIESWIRIAIGRQFWKSQKSTARNLTSLLCIPLLSTPPVSDSSSRYIYQRCCWDLFKKILTKVSSTSLVAQLGDLSHCYLDLFCDHITVMYGSLKIVLLHDLWCWFVVSLLRRFFPTWKKK